MGYPIPKEVSPIWFILFVVFLFYLDGGEGPGFEAGIETFCFVFCFLFFLYNTSALADPLTQSPSKSTLC